MTWKDSDTPPKTKTHVSGKISTKEVRELLGMDLSEFRELKLMLGIKPVHNRWFYLQNCPFAYMLCYRAYRIKYKHNGPRFAVMKANKFLDSGMELADFIRSEKARTPNKEYRRIVKLRRQVKRQLYIEKLRLF